MRRSVGLLAVPGLLAVLAILGGCGADLASRSATIVSAPDVRACEEVRLGIDAFNAGELDETVTHFELAVPLAESEAAAQDSRESDALLEAVRYYADLPAEDYPEAAATSPEFARYKAITLGLCAPAAPSGSPDSQLT